MSKSTGSTSIRVHPVFGTLLQYGEQLGDGSSENKQRAAEKVVNNPCCCDRLKKTWLEKNQETKTNVIDQSNPPFLGSLTRKTIQNTAVPRCAHHQYDDDIHRAIDNLINPPWSMQNHIANPKIERPPTQPDSRRKTQIDYSIIVAEIQKLDIRVLDFANHIQCGLTKEEMVGSGVSMDVYEGYLTIKEKPIKVVLKRPRDLIKPNAPDHRINVMLKDIRQELRMMKQFERHPNIVDLYGVAFKDLKPLLVVEFAVTNLTKYISESTVDWQTKKRFCCEIADGLLAMHQINVVHGDIKGDNILLFTDSGIEDRIVAKISDFGYSKTRFSIDAGNSTTGAVAFQAPELTGPWKNKPENDKYSYGLLVWQIAKDGEVPFGELKRDEIKELKHADKNLDKLMNQLDRGTPEEFKTVIAATTRYNPKDRISLADVREMMNVADDERYAEAKAAFEANVKELPRNFDRAELDPLNRMSIPFTIQARLFRAYEAAALKKDPEAATYLSVCCATGFGVGINKKEMVSWAIKAAQYGSLDAVLNIIKHYQLDDLPDPITFFPYLLKAAEAGHSDAKDAVSRCYSAGIGVKKNINKSLEWRISKEVPVNPMGSHDRSICCKPVKTFTMLTSLHRAAREGNLESVKYIVQQDGIDVNAKDREGSTSLHAAAKLGLMEMVRLLIGDLGADVNARDSNGATPLHVAAASGQTETVSVLVRDFNADVNARDSEEETPLNLAAEEGMADIVKILAKGYGAEVKAKDSGGRTALYLAASNGYVNVVKMLAQEFDVDANERDSTGATPLHAAAQWSCTEMVEVLVVEFGAEVNVTDWEGRTPLHLAVDQGQQEVIRNLVGIFGANVNAKDFNGRTPLHYAAQYYTAEAVKILAGEFGADVNAKDEGGHTPLDLSTERNTKSIIDLLREYGAVEGKNTAC